MAVIEVLTFRTVPDVDEAEFLDADQQVQTEFVYAQPGVLRRTTARDGDDWLVLTMWGSSGDADASARAARDDDTVSRWARNLEPTSVTTRRYHTLD
jgi:hypothetical protein